MELSIQRKLEINHFVLKDYYLQGLSCIGLSYKEVQSDPSEWSEQKLLDQMTFIAVFGIKDEV